ncbi:hypothetical protein PTKIN_Ptkin02bG0159600 [Pterospermum kingtungense]
MLSGAYAFFLLFFFVVHGRGRLEHHSICSVFPQSFPYLKIMKARNAESLYLKSPPSLFLFMLSILLFCLFPLSKATLIDVGNISFTHPALTPNNVGDIVFDGAAQPSDHGIQLTSSDYNDKFITGRATYAKPMHLWDNISRKLVLADFSTQFSFSIHPFNPLENLTRGSGFAFFLAPASNGSKIPPQSDGGYLGLQSKDPVYNTTSTSNKFVAVEFDTYPSDWDPVGIEEHVAIDRNSVEKSLNYVEWSWFDSVYVTGGKVNASISYNSSTKNLSVFFCDADGYAFENSSSLSAQLDLSRYLPEWVTFGFSGATGDTYELHTIYSWDFSSSLLVDKKTIPPKPAPTSSPAVNPKKKSRTWVWVVLGIVGGIFALLLVWLASLYRRIFGKDHEDNDDATDDQEIDDDFERGTGPRKFSYNELAHATDNFKHVRKLGQGGFGGVYKGFLRDSSSYVAIKKVSSESQQGKKEYASEVKIISRLRHRNLVQLIGWCHERKQLLLVYEFMPNGSLDSHLFTENSLLQWEDRYKIAQGLASGLLYLHEGWEQCVLHRDIKSSNVLLDSDFNVKLGDFGLARLVDHAKGSQTTVVAGTMGYMAPEYHLTGKASKQSDVYSFGVVALEIACGRKAIDPKAGEDRANLVNWVWELYGEGKLLEACDPRLCGEFAEQDMQQLMIVGLWCAHPDENSRPSMKQAIHVLNFEAPLPILPSKMPVPTYHPPNVHAFQVSYSATDSEGLRNLFSSHSYSTSSSQPI